MILQEHDYRVPEDHDQEPQCFVMPFGKHKGEMLGDMPVSYLAWLIGQPYVNDPLKSAAQKTYDMLKRSGE